MYKRLFLILVLLVISALAGENFFEPGIRYRVFETKVNTNSDEKLLTSYNQTDSITKKTDLIAKFNLGFNSLNFRYYVRTAKMEPSIELGVKYKNSNQIYDVGLIKDLQKEAFVNPYLLNSQRDETRINAVEFKSNISKKNPFKAYFFNNL